MGVRRKAPATAKSTAPAKKAGAKKPAAVRDDAPRILHCHSTFAPGGKELRSVRLMNAFGPRLRHTLVSAMPDQMGAREHLSRQTKVEFPDNFPSLKGLPTPGRLAELAKAMKNYDLVLTYNWGAMDVAMAHTVFAQNMGLPPLIHHEDGFNEDEASELKTRRNWYRRVGLGRAAGLVVPSKRLETIALNIWNQPRGRVVRIPNGIDTRAYTRKPFPAVLGLMKGEGHKWVGTLAGFRAVKRLDRLVRAFAVLPEEWHLVLLGDGPERPAIVAVASELGIRDRVHMPGIVTDPAGVIGLFDIFALSSASEQFPISVVEAMSAGLPIAAPDVGDITDMVAEPNGPYIARADDTGELARMFEMLAGDAQLRKALGEANRDKARALFDKTNMIERYRALYSSAMGRPI
jgi:glycosyltransferase involved in cell wall biosynthesis